MKKQPKDAVIARLTKERDEALRKWVTACDEWHYHERVVAKLIETLSHYKHTHCSREGHGYCAANVLALWTKKATA